MKNPSVGIGIIIQNDKGEILVGKRKGSHSPYYSIPGGKLDLGETLEEGIRRETLEETGLEIINPKVICITNNLRTFKESNVHFVSVDFFTNEYKGIPQVMEPEKCEGWIWVDPKHLPQPHFDASEFAVECFLQEKFYIPNQK